MQQIKEAIAKHGNKWTLQTNADMIELYEPLHAQQTHRFAQTIKVVKGVKYGSHDRHRLDIYQPATIGSNAFLPVVAFFHGGGFTSGDTDITASMYSNIGNFFATNNCVCALGTYRLLPEARYPSGGQDVTAALLWLQNHARKYQGDPDKLFAIGQSAGGAHLASAVWGGLTSDASVGLSGIVLLSPPLRYDLRQERRRKNMILYHDTDDEDEISRKTGVSVFLNSKIAEESKLLLMVAELDSDEIVDGCLAFVDAHRKKYSRLPLFEVMAGHNHISNTLAIGLPDDLVGRRILMFILHSC